jgi:pSer/pThr/pTyr-binding forkhead associated (FHA) protein
MWRRSKPDLVGSVEVAGVPYALRGKRPVTVGADPKSRISIQGVGVLPRHAELRPMGSPKRPRVVIRSLDPANPVLVNGMEVPSQTLENGDVVKVGDQTFTYFGPEQFDDPGSLTADDSAGAGGWKF